MELQQQRPTQHPASYRVLRSGLWVVLIAFLAWDFWVSPPVDLRYEAPLIAAGSGKAIQSGHCAMPSGN